MAPAATDHAGDIGDIHTTNTNHHSSSTSATTTTTASTSSTTTTSTTKSISTASSQPQLAHHLHHASSILTLVVGAGQIYAGTQDGEIIVWSLDAFELRARIQAHSRAVLCLFLTDGDNDNDDGNGHGNGNGNGNSNVLLSSAGDAIVNVWDPRTLVRRFHIYSTYDVGDLFCAAYSVQRESVYLGAQNTSIQWCSLRADDVAARPPPRPERHPERRQHHFFGPNSPGQQQRRRDSAASCDQESPPLPTTTTTTLEVDTAHIQHYAHFGYVYAMLMTRAVSRKVAADLDVLISAGGDGTVKIWRLGSGPAAPGLREVTCLGEDDGESVLSIAVDGQFLYSGKLAGVIELWDLETEQKLRVIKAHDADIMTLQMGWGYLWSGGAAGDSMYGKYRNPDSTVGQRYRCINDWQSHQGRIMASATVRHANAELYITGANDGSISVWNVACRARPGDGGGGGGGPAPQDPLLKSLQDFVSFKTISARPDHTEDCRSGATFLRTLFTKHGAQTEMLNTDKHNPIVYARFRGNPKTVQARKRILFYGHYDVVPADNKQQRWLGDPFEMKGINGYLYGRGVSDNKGPILAALYAVVDLVDRGELEGDIVFIIEGEEETGSRGFNDTIRRHKDLIGHIDYIILANSYWLDDEVPCLTYGLRGVLHATVKVDSRHPDVHSGVDGSFMMDEPLFDLTSILAQLKGHHNRVQIPGFYDDVLPLTPAEEALYDDITSTLMKRNPDNGPADTLKASLMARWREPNLTVHRYKVSGPDGSLVSSQASAAISIRLVPKQEVDDVIASLTTYLESAFARLDTHNHLSITIDNRADAWLGDPDNDIFRTLEEAVMEVWGSTGGEPAVAIRRQSSQGNVNSKHSSRPTSSSGASQKMTPATATSLANATSPPVLNSGTFPTPFRPLPSGGDAADDEMSRGGAGGEVASTAVAPTSTAAAPPTTSTTSTTSTTFAPTPRPALPIRRRPLYIREGGSIPSIRFLEKEFGAPAAHLPCGQASDAAHLENERLRVRNLVKSREIFRLVFARLPRR